MHYPRRPGDVHIALQVRWGAEFGRVSVAGLENTSASLPLQGTAAPAPGFSLTLFRAQQVCNKVRTPEAAVTLNDLLVRTWTQTFAPEVQKRSASNYGSCRKLMINRGHFLFKAAGSGLNLAPWSCTCLNFAATKSMDCIVATLKSLVRKG